MGLKSRVADSLEESLSFGEERVVVEIVADSAISWENFLLFWKFIECNELGIEIDLSQDWYQDFEGKFEIHFYQNSNRIPLVSRA